MITKQTRHEFEQWAAPEKLDARSIERDSNGNYKLMATATAWNVWQAATEIADQKMQTMVKLKEREQNALAELAQLAVRVKHLLQNETLPGESLLNDLTDIGERYSSVNWGDVYDKMHRSGCNA